MSANIRAIRDDADAIYEVEAALSGNLYNLSFAAEHGHGSTSEAITSVRASRRHADLAVVATAAGNVVMAAKQELQAATADADAARMLGRAKGYAEELEDGLEAAAEHSSSALGRARSLVGLDDSSPAAEVHAKIADQPEGIRAMLRRVQEIRHHVPHSRDPTDLESAAEHFIALRHELEEASGRAQAVASDSLGYGNAI